ncbi:MAG: hypothetical protein AABX89_06865 [Candidatus Thermoplasmatota archaeon]
MPIFESVQVHQETKAVLAGLRRGGESYDSLVRRLVAEAEAAQTIAFHRELDALFLDDAGFEPLR